MGKAIMPSEHEMNTMRRWKGDISQLGKAEKFFAAVSKMPRLGAKLSSFAFVASFSDTASTLGARANLLTAACAQLTESEALATVLKRMLTVGNTLNEGTRRGGATGFTLNSLLKLTSTKGVDNKTTILDYVVGLMLEKGQGAVIDATLAVLPALDRASRVNSL